jgi:hypothetical protein
MIKGGVYYALIWFVFKFELVSVLILKYFRRKYENN